MQYIIVQNSGLHPDCTFHQYKIFWIIHPQYMYILVCNLVLVFSFLHAKGSSRTRYFGDHWSSRWNFTKSHLFKRFQKTSHTKMKTYLTRHLFSRKQFSPQLLHRNTDPTKSFSRTHQQAKTMSQKSPKLENIHISPLQCYLNIWKMEFL